ncbi:hypothetical protein LAY41_29225 [Argonema galeatum A003/A1]|nr:hypothetical protein [Argonema galeatum A003/A1]
MLDYEKPSKNSISPNKGEDNEKLWFAGRGLKMYSLKIRYTASVFVDAESIIPNARNITGLMNALGDEVLLPKTVEEQSPAGVLPRISFNTADGEWQFLLLSKQFTLIHSATVPDGSNLGDFSTFCRNAIPKLTTALNYFQRKAHRLAASQEGFLSEMTQTEMENIAFRLMKFPSIYSKQFPFEWNWRSAALIEREFGGIQEITNMITTVSKLLGYLTETRTEGIAQSLFDRIMVNFEINTSANNVIARFDDLHLAGFFEQSGLWHNELSSEIFEFILKG